MEQTRLSAVAWTILWPKTPLVSTPLLGGIIFVPTRGFVNSFYPCILRNVCRLDTVRRKGDLKLIDLLGIRLLFQMYN